MLILTRSLIITSVGGLSQAPGWGWMWSALVRAHLTALLSRTLPVQGLLQKIRAPV